LSRDPIVNSGSPTGIPLTPAVLRWILHSRGKGSADEGNCVTVQESIQALRADGWRIVREDELTRQLRHDSKPGIVTVAGKADLKLPPGVLQGLLGHSQLKENG
jgi:predicted RNA binding protein YcfA (HicA-like mRNA interferase family)